MVEKNKGKQTREAILKLASQLFTLHGYHHTSLSDILGAVTISKGAFYHHFKSKEELALAVLDGVREDCAAKFSELCKGSGSSGDGLFLLLKELSTADFAGQWEHGLLLARFVQETSDAEGALADRVDAVVQWLLSYWGKLLRKAQGSGAISAELSCESLAGMILSAWFGAVSLTGLNHSVMSREAVLGQIVALLKVSE